ASTSSAAYSSSTSRIVGEPTGIGDQALAFRHERFAVATRPEPLRRRDQLRRARGIVRYLHPSWCQEELASRQLVVAGTLLHDESETPESRPDRHVLEEDQILDQSG